MHQQSRPSTGYGGDQGGWFKEGSLVGDQDYGYLQPFTMRLDVSGLTAAETANPFRLKITAEHNQAANNDYLTLYSTVSDSAALVRFVLGHYVVLEVPR